MNLPLLLTLASRRWMRELAAARPVLAGARCVAVRRLRLIVCTVTLKAAAPGDPGEGGSVPGLERRDCPI